MQHVEAMPLTDVRRRAVTRSIDRRPRMKRSSGYGFCDETGAPHGLNCRGMRYGCRKRDLACHQSNNPGRIPTGIPSSSK